MFNYVQFFKVVHNSEIYEVAFSSILKSITYTLFFHTKSIVTDAFFIRLFRMRINNYNNLIKCIVLK